MTDLSNIVDAEREKTFDAAMEEEARRILEIPGDPGAFPLLASLDEEIALALAHIDGLRAVRQSQMRSLAHVECYVDTELMQMESRTPRYSPYRFPEREKLQRRLFEIEGERRKTAMSHEEKLRELRLRLFGLLRKRKLLDEAAA